MPVELRVPKVGESITEVQVGDWLVAEGGTVQRDAPVVVLETDKATMELPAPVAGTLVRSLKRKGEIAKVGEAIGIMEEGAVATAPPPAKPPELKPREAAPEPPARRIPPSRRHKDEPSSPPAPQPTSSPARQPQSPPAPQPASPPSAGEEVVPMSLFRRRLAERLVQA
ncbi:MAG: dihydrolipoamide succinyltransferase, partial [Planctomycetia bacterium]|nr:dihydrolipoamide succinyltransferase [Planctomycetia bacterium]